MDLQKECERVRAGKGKYYLHPSKDTKEPLYIYNDNQ